MTEAKIGFSNPAIKGRPVPYPKGHPEEGKPMEFNKAETEGKNRYDRYNRKHGTKFVQINLHQKKKLSKQKTNQERVVAKRMLVIIRLSLVIL